MKQYYSIILDNPYSVVVCVEDESRRICGFASGTLDASAHFANLKNNRIRLGLALLPSIVRKPRILVEALSRYRSTELESERPFTKRSGIARGFYTEEQFQQLTMELVNFFSINGIEISKVYHCPHAPLTENSRISDGCDCRKPKPGMLLMAEKDFTLDMSESIVFGDKPSDIEAGKAAGVGRGFLIKANGKWPNLLSCVNDLTTQNTKWIMK